MPPTLITSEALHIQVARRPAPPRRASSSLAPRRGAASVARPAATPTPLCAGPGRPDRSVPGRVANQIVLPRLGRAGPCWAELRICERVRARLCRAEPSHEPGKFEFKQSRAGPGRRDSVGWRRKVNAGRQDEGHMYFLLFFCLAPTPLCPLATRCMSGSPQPIG